MPRSIWTGAISFGLVNVPVKLYSAVSKKTVRFHQLHEADGVRIQQKRVCPADGEEVAWDDIVKGYEISPDRYVVVTSDELEALDPKKTRTIDIEEFADLEDIDPHYHDEYSEAVLDMIERKAEGEEIVLQPAEEPEKVPDLMAALEASLAAAKEDGGGNGSGAKKPATRGGSRAKAKPKSKPRAKSKS